jgi:hypothetical protein
MKKLWKLLQRELRSCTMMFECGEMIRFDMGSSNILRREMTNSADTEV